MAESREKRRRKEQSAERRERAAGALKFFLGLTLKLAIVAAFAGGGYVLYQRGYLKWAIDQFSVKKDLDLATRLREEYPDPVIRPLEELAAEWDRIPREMIPRTVTLKREVDYQMQVDGKRSGGTRMPAGHQAAVMERKGAQLLVTVNPETTLRAIVPINDTEIPDLVAGQYKKESEQALVRVLSAREAAEEVLKRTSQEGDPRRLPDGWHDSAAVVLFPVRDYLKEGRLPGRTLDQAKRFGWLGKQRVEEDNYDVVVVMFEVDTLFGPGPHALKCLLQHGQVKKWIDPATPADP